MAMPRKYLPIGKRVGFLVVVSHDSVTKRGRAGMSCRCDCSALIVLDYSTLMSGQLSCGCMASALKSAFKVRHGRCGTREYNIWKGMRKRCCNKNDNNYHRYGARGIRVCDRWLSFENFLIDMGKCPDKWSIDRIDGRGHYEPSNCRWASRTTQNNNTIRHQDARRTP